MPIGPMAVVPHVYKDITYDPIKDFTPIALGATFQFAIAAGPASGAKNWNEFVAWAKANPTQGRLRDVRRGQPAALLRRAARHAASASRWCTCRTRAPPRTSTTSSAARCPAAIDAIADLTELHRAGKVKVLASSGATRSTALPDVPTFDELGVKGVEAMGWFGFFAPAKTPEADRRRAERARSTRRCSRPTWPRSFRSSAWIPPPERRSNSRRSSPPTTRSGGRS